MQNYLPACKIVSTHGVRGEMKALPLCDGAAFLAKFKRLFTTADGAGETRNDSYSAAVQPPAGKTGYFDRARLPVRHEAGEHPAGRASAGYAVRGRGPRHADRRRYGRDLPHLALAGHVHHPRLE